MKIRGLFVGAVVLMTLVPKPVQADEVVVTLGVVSSSPTPGAPGTWEILARIEDTDSGADGSLGLSALRILLNDIDFGTDGDAITIASGIGAINPVPTNAGPRAPTLLLTSGVIDILYGQDIESGPIVPNVGVGGDTLIAFGTFSSGLTPDFGLDGSLPTQALFLTSTTPSVGNNAIDPDATILEVNRSSIPEPTSLALLLVGGVALATRRLSRG